MTCTCDDENTLVTVDASVDMGYENGGVIYMCAACYDVMLEEA